MTGLEYMRTICPTTSVGKDPNREDVQDAFEDGIAEGYEQAEKDLALTGEDILNISKILHQLEAEDWCSELIFDEAARIFNEQREKK